MNVLDGKKLALDLQHTLAKKVQDFCFSGGKRPFLVMILVGDDPASLIYVRRKIKACETVGIRSQVIRLKEDVSFSFLRQTIQDLNQNSEVSALLVQLPLPKRFDSKDVISWINPLKDVDGLTAENQGLAWIGKPRILPCTPLGIMKLLNFYRIPLQAKKAVVIGRSRIVGLPMAQLLLKANATITICHSQTRHLADITRDCDVVVVASGKPGLLGIDDFKPSATVIDVGIHRVCKDGKTTLVGDIRLNEFSSFKGWITPVPGGVGPLTVACLLENTFKLSKSL